VAEPEPPPKDFAFSLVAFVVALLPRLYVAIAWAREPVWDGHYYDFGARRIAAGMGYSDDLIAGGRTLWHPWCHYPVGYSGFLAAAYSLFGESRWVATTANALVGALLAVVVHRLALRVTTVARARIATLLTALFPGLILYAALLMTEPLAALGLLTATWLFARDRHAHPLRAAVLAGITLGLTTLVRPQSILFAPALGLLLLERPRPALSRIALCTALATGSALLVVAPWTIRNCRVMDGCAFVSTNAGWNLAIGAFPRATGRFETLRASDGCPVVSGQVQQDACWRSEALQWIARGPGRWAGLIPAKLSFTFDHESFPIGYLAEADPKAWPEERRAKGRMILNIAHRSLLVLAPLGFIALPVHSRRLPRLTQLAALIALALFVLWALNSDPKPFWPLAIAIPVLAFARLPGSPQHAGILAYLAFAVASVCVTHSIFFGEDRYHIVITPVLCLLAACALRRPGSADAGSGQSASSCSASLSDRSE
jgi:4-amino-4-deoxy-L-arabinose transferase-like glycosyltransferase